MFNVAIGVRVQRIQSNVALRVEKDSGGQHWQPNPGCLFLCVERGKTAAILLAVSVPSLVIRHAGEPVVLPLSSAVDAQPALQKPQGAIEIGRRER
jgi:hypothetical protein